MTRGAGGRRSPVVAVAGTAASLLVPFVLALGFVPLRSRLPNVDLALLLVVAVGAMGLSGARHLVVVGAVSAAFWFEFFDTVPYDRLAIARNPDVETTVVLAVVAALVGELTVRLSASRRAGRERDRGLATIRSAAQLVASGEELVRVLEAVVADLSRVLRLSSCRFEADEAAARPRLEQNGLFLAPDGAVLDRAPEGPFEVELPVVVQGERIGCFVLGLEGELPGRELRVFALTLADNVGAAFLAQAPPPLPPGSGPGPLLRLLGGQADPPARLPGGAAERIGPKTQETAGFSLKEGVANR